MYGLAEKISDMQHAKKMEISFTSEYIMVILPLDGQNYMIHVVNQDGQTYCTKAKGSINFLPVTKNC